MLENVARKIKMPVPSLASTDWASVPGNEWNNNSFYTVYKMTVVCSIGEWEEKVKNTPPPRPGAARNDVLAIIMTMMGIIMDHGCYAIGRITVLIKDLFFCTKKTR